MNTDFGIQDGEFENVTSVLLLAPLSEPPDNQACVDLLTPVELERENVLSVSISETPDERLALWQRHVGETLPKRAAIIGTEGSVTDRAEPTKREQEYPVRVDLLSDPLDPLELASLIGQRLGAWSDSSDPTFVCIHSLTALFDLLDQSEVGRLVTVLNDRFATTNAVAHYHMDSTSSDEQTLTEIRSAFDIVVEYTDDGDWIITRSDGEASRSSGPDTASQSGGVDEPSTLDQPTPTYSFDTVMELLSSSRRRAVLYFLCSNGDGSVSLETLVDEVLELGSELATGGESTTEQDISISLYHHHLPRLEDAEIIQFDRDTETVRYRSNPALETCVKRARECESLI